MCVGDIARPSGPKISPFSKAGTYTFAITEKAGAAGGVSYSGATSTATVTVTDKLDGTLSASVAYAGAGDDGQTFTPQKGYHSKLVRNGDRSFDFVDKAGNRHHFREPVDPAKPLGALRLEYMEEPHGDRLRVSYDGQGRVSTVAEVHPEAGDVRKLRFTWAQAGGFDRISAVESDSTLALRVEYEYDRYGNLKTARRPGTNLSGLPTSAVRVESYGYSIDDARDKHQLLFATDPNGSRTEYEYYRKTDDFPGEAGSRWRPTGCMRDSMSRNHATGKVPPCRSTPRRPGRSICAIVQRAPQRCAIPGWW